MSHLRTAQIIESVAALNPNGIDGRCHFCKRRTEDAVEKHALKCVWRSSVMYVKQQVKSGNSNN